MERVDVLVVGAGLSGVGAACHLRRKLPEKSFVILEGRDAMGGTWDLFRYPGVRSDSDMYTLGYRFRPWRDAKAIADGSAILNYIRETASEFGVDKKIRYGHRVKRAYWSSEEAAWTVEAEAGPEKSLVRITCNFLYLCTGYYDLKHFTPQYNPWDQRLCLAPNADIFRAIRAGRASVVTDHIETFTETGLLLRSGQQLE